MTPASVIEGPENMTKATDMGIPFYYVNKNRENQLCGIYAVTSGNHGVDLVPSQSVKNARMKSENHRKTVDVFLTLHYQMGKFHLEYNGSSLIVSPMDESAARLIEPNTSASSARELLALFVNSAINKLEVTPENLDAVYLNMQQK